MAEITDPFAPFTPAPFASIDTSRFGIDADKCREARPEDIALSAHYRAEVRGRAPGEVEREIAVRGANE